MLELVKVLESLEETKIYMDDKLMDEDAYEYEIEMDIDYKVEYYGWDRKELVEAAEAEEEENRWEYRYVWYDITVDGKKVGSAEVSYTTRGGELEDGGYIERVDIYEGYRSKGYGTETFEKLASMYGCIYLAPDNKDAQRLYARLGEEVATEAYPDQGYGIYRID